MCLESGLTRSKNNINIAVKNLADFAVSTFCFWLVGYGLMFGSSLFGWFGQDHFAADWQQQPDDIAFFLFPNHVLRNCHNHCFWGDRRTCEV